MAVNIKAEDLFVVQKHRGGVSKGVGNYTGAQLEEDILSIISTSSGDVRTWVQPSPPPVAGVPDLAAIGHFWFDTEINNLFVAVQSSDGAGDPTKWDWVVCNIDHLKTGGGTGSPGETFPFEPADGTEVTHMNGITYTYYSMKKQWLFLNGPLYDSVVALQEDKVDRAGDTITGTLVHKNTKNNRYSSYYNGDTAIAELTVEPGNDTLRINPKPGCALKITTIDTAGNAKQCFKTYNDATCRVQALRDGVNASDAATVGQIEAGYLPLTGGVLTGPLDIDGADVRIKGGLKVKGKDQPIGGDNILYVDENSVQVNHTLSIANTQGGNQRLNFTGSNNADIARNGIWMISMQSSSVKFNYNIDMSTKNIINVKTPTSSHHAVNKSYVDDKVGSGPGFGVPYVFRGTTGPGSLKSGEFSIDGKIYASHIDKNGRQIGTTVSNWWKSGIDYFVKIYDSNGNIKRFYKGGEFHHGGHEGGNNVIKWYISDTIQESSLSSGSTYYLSDTYMLPY